MLTLALTITLIVLAVLVPALCVARYWEWRVWDDDRRIQRLRDRRLGARRT